MKARRRAPYVKINDENNSPPVGGFKRLFGLGLQRVCAKRLEEVTGELAALLAKDDDFKRTHIIFDILDMKKTREKPTGIFPHRGVNYWW